MALFLTLSIIGDAGEAIVETVFGALSVGSGDHVLIPRSTTHRWVPQGNEELRAYCIEANSHITPARRYLSRFGASYWNTPPTVSEICGPKDLSSLRKLMSTCSSSTVIAQPA